jgi:pyridoxal phosphate enzyme (YggS family)
LASQRNEIVRQTLQENIVNLQERIAVACKMANRRPEEVTLVAVTKTVEAWRVALAHELGLAQFGENRVQEAAEKIPIVKAQAAWHLIGHLQTNKAKRAVELFDIIQSVDSARVARAISTNAVTVQKEMRVLLEVNVSGEITKSGFASQEVEAAVGEMIALPGLRIEGLMTIAPIVGTPELARPYFARLRRLRDELQVAFPEVQWRHLSMGMTDDFEAGIAEGATIVRIGRAIFGERENAR